MSYWTERHILHFGSVDTGSHENFLNSLHLEQGEIILKMLILTVFMASSVHKTINNCQRKCISIKIISI